MAARRALGKFVYHPDVQSRVGALDLVGQTGIWYTGGNCY